MDVLLGATRDAVGAVVGFLLFGALTVWASWHARQDDASETRSMFAESLRELLRPPAPLVLAIGLLAVIVVLIVLA